MFLIIASYVVDHTLDLCCYNFYFITHSFLTIVNMNSESWKLNYTYNTYVRTAGTNHVCVWGRLITKKWQFFSCSDIAYNRIYALMFILVFFIFKICNARSCDTFPKHDALHMKSNTINYHTCVKCGTRKRDTCMLSCVLFQ